MNRIRLILWHAKVAMARAEARMVARTEDGTEQVWAEWWRATTQPHR